MGGDAAVVAARGQHEGSKKGEHGHTEANPGSHRPSVRDPSANESDACLDPDRQIGWGGLQFPESGCR